MADGSFYEGQFQDGEIQGHGFRRWASSRNEYTGQFVKGELMGHGVMAYGNGSRYEGQWLNNGKEGNMIPGGGGVTLIGIGQNVLYKGIFPSKLSFCWPMWIIAGKYSLLIDNNLLGEGKWIGRDGSVYEGSFHNNKKHGEGKLLYRYSDFSIT